MRIPFVAIFIDVFPYSVKLIFAFLVLFRHTGKHVWCRLCLFFSINCYSTGPVSLSLKTVQFKLLVLWQNLYNLTTRKSSTLCDWRAHSETQSKDFEQKEFKKTARGKQSYKQRNSIVNFSLAILRIKRTLIFSSKLNITDVPLWHIITCLLPLTNTALIEFTYRRLTEVKAAVNHDVLQQFLICAGTK